MFAFRDVCIYFGKKTPSSAHLYIYWLYLYNVFTRHLEARFQSAVPAIFLSYAPTFFNENFDDPLPFWMTWSSRSIYLSKSNIIRWEPPFVLLK